MGNDKNWLIEELESDKEDFDNLREDEKEVIRIRVIGDYKEDSEFSYVREKSNEKT